MPAMKKATKKKKDPVLKRSQDSIAEDCSPKKKAKRKPEKKPIVRPAKKKVKKKRVARCQGDQPAFKEPTKFQAALEEALRPCPIASLLLEDRDLCSKLSEFVDDITIPPPLEWERAKGELMTILDDVWFDGSASDVDHRMSYTTRTFSGSTLNEIEADIQKSFTVSGDDSFLRVNRDFEYLFKQTGRRGSPYWHHKEDDNEMFGPNCIEAQDALVKLAQRQMGTGFHWANEDEPVMYECGYGLVNYDGGAIIFYNDNLVWA